MREGPGGGETGRHGGREAKGPTVIAGVCLEGDLD